MLCREVIKLYPLLVWMDRFCGSLDDTKVDRFPCIHHCIFGRLLTLDVTGQMLFGKRRKALDMPPSVDGHIGSVRDSACTVIFMRVNILRYS